MANIDIYVSTRLRDVLITPLEKVQPSAPFRLVERIEDVTTKPGLVFMGDDEYTPESSEGICLYVVRTSSTLEKSDAEKIWMDPHVHNYDTPDGYTVEKLRKIVDDLSRMVGHQDSSVHEIGFSVKALPGAGIYLRGMEQALIQLREAALIAQSYNAWIRDAEQYNFAWEAQEVIDHFLGSNKTQQEQVIKRLNRYRDLAKSHSTILPHIIIHGETGTGKTLLARWLHRQRLPLPVSGGDRTKYETLRDKNFCSLNCSTLGNRASGELFGAKKGSWTPLNENRPGQILSAFCGTLFLDEIGDLPNETQPNLLTFLDRGEFAPEGYYGDKIFAPVLIVGATNKKLTELRPDLLARFRIRIHLDPLKDRDVAQLHQIIDLMLQDPGINPDQGVNRIAKDALEKICTHIKKHGLEGNFRELERILWRSVLNAKRFGSKTLCKSHCMEAPESDPK